MFTQAEENYLKTILSISLRNDGRISTNEIANEIGTSPASVSDMFKKLQEKKLIKYKKYQGVSLTKKGRKNATNILRKHRLWETFLVNTLNFSWDEVHIIAEQLEHIQSEKLIDELDDFLDKPKFDPHGDPIPSKEGKIPLSDFKSLNKLKVGDKGIIMGVKLDKKSFLQYLNQIKIQIGVEIKIINKVNFDKSMEVKTKYKTFFLSNDVSKNLLIKKL
ncbi:MAG: iron-dependent repressor [Flavobacteriales bacterium]|nr:iron-dependent repressor [Flavobacteriales bacterium]